MYGLWLIVANMAIVYGQTERRSSSVGMGGSRSETFKGNGSFLGGCEEGGFK